MPDQPTPDQRSVRANVALTEVPIPMLSYMSVSIQSAMVPEQKTMWFRECIWEAINEYAKVCGGDASDSTISDSRMNAVVKIERLLELNPIAGMVKAELQTERQAREAADHWRARAVELAQHCWVRDGIGMVHCRVCGAWNPDHAPGCIVGETLGAKRGE